MANGKKKKLTVNRFVEVMSRGLVVLDDGSGGGRARSFDDRKRLEDLQARLAALDVTSRDLQARLDDYDTAWRTATAQQDKGEERRLFDELASRMAKSVQEAQARFATWFAAAQKRRTLADALARQLAALQARVASVPLPAIRPALAARVAALQAQAVPRTLDATVLDADVARLTRLQSESLPDDIEGYITAGEQLQAQQRQLTTAIADAATSYARLPASGLRTLLEGGLQAARDRQRALSAPPKSLFDLADQRQSLADLVRGLVENDVDALRDRLAEYQRDVDDIQAGLAPVRAQVAAWPAMPIRTEVVQGIDELLAAITPIASIASPAALTHAWGALAGTKTDWLLSPFDTWVERVTGYDDQLAALRTAWQAKSDAASALPASLLRQSLLDDLAALRDRATPLAQVASTDKLGAATRALESLVETMRDVDIDLYVTAMGDYRDAWTAFDAAQAAKAVEIAVHADADVRAAAGATLAQLREGAVPPERLDGTDALVERTAALVKLRQRVEAIDLAAAAGPAQANRQAATALKAAIEAKVAQLAGGLGAGAQARLRAEFMKEFDELVAPGPIDTLRERLARLEQLAQRVAARRVDHPPHQVQRFARADQRVAQSQALVAALPTPALRQAAQAALDGMTGRLEQLKLNQSPAGMPGKLTIGSAKGGTEDVALAASEQTRALDNALKSLQETLADPAGVGTKMLAFEGGEAFASAICSMNNALVAFGASHAGISAAEALAVRRYTGEDYPAMNRNRRGLEADDRLAFLNQVCDQALAKMPPYPDNAWPAYRIESAWSQDVVDSRYARGRQFVCGVLWSTGARAGEAIGLRSSPRFTHVIYGQRGRDVAALSAHLGEGAGRADGVNFNANAGRGEVLFPADSGFRVTDRTDPPGAPESIRYMNKPGTAHIQTQLKELLNG